MLIRTCSDVKMLWNRARGTDLMFMREASEKEDGSNGVESGVESMFVKSHDQLRKLKINMNSMQENIKQREHLLSTSQHQQNIHQETDTVPTTLPTTLATSISSGLWGRIPSMPSMFGGSGTPSKNTTVELDEEKAQQKSNREEEEEMQATKKKKMQQCLQDSKDVALYVQMQRMMVDLLSENINMREQLNAYTEAFLRPTLEKDEEFRRQHQEASGEGAPRQLSITVRQPKEEQHRDIVVVNKPVKSWLDIPDDEENEEDEEDEEDNEDNDNDNEDKKNKKKNAFIEVNDFEDELEDRNQKVENKVENDVKDQDVRDLLNYYSVTFGQGSIGLKLEIHEQGVQITEIQEKSNADLYNGKAKRSMRIMVGDHLLKVGDVNVSGMPIRGTNGILSVISNAERPVVFKFQTVVEKSEKKEKNIYKEISKRKKKKKKKKKKKEIKKRENQSDKIDKVDVQKFVNVHVGRRVFAKSNKKNNCLWKFGEIASVNEVMGTFSVDFDDGIYCKGMSTEHIRVTLTGSTRGKKEKDYILLSSFVGVSHRSREQEELVEDDFDMVSYGGQKKMNKMTTKDDYDPSNW